MSLSRPRLVAAMMGPGAVGAVQTVMKQWQQEGRRHSGACLDCRREPP